MLKLAATMCDDELLASSNFEAGTAKPLNLLTTVALAVPVTSPRICWVNIKGSVRAGTTYKAIGYGERSGCAYRMCPI